MNMFKNKVRIPFYVILTPILCYLAFSKCAERPYLAMFGLKETPFGHGYQFKNLYKIKIKFDVNITDLPPPELLNCTKYGNSDEESSGESPGDTLNRRRKRSVDDSFRMDGLTLCDYQFNPRDQQSMVESEEEEEFWQNEVMTGKSQVFCDSGFGDYCLLRRLHLPNFTISWHRRYLPRQKQFAVEPSYLIYNPRKRISISKEIYSIGQSLCYKQLKKAEL